MSQQTTLTSVFEDHKELLADRLHSYSLPRDSKDVQKTVADFLNDLFESDGAYRQGLTQSEDYILQSAIMLLKAQQDIAGEIISTANTYNASPKVVTKPNPNQYSSVLGTGIGAVAGSLLGTWGAVCGAIAGTAIAIYLATKAKNTSQPTSENTPTKTINVNAFVNIVKKICESIDNLMETYRVQVRRIENAYRNTEEESPLSKYAHLFSQIEDLHEVIESEKVQVPESVIDAETSIIRSLRNYGLSMENGKIVSNK